MGGDLPTATSQDRRHLYEQICSSYRAIDEFRAKLLALLPLAAGSGIFLLVGNQTQAGRIAPYLPAVGLFGFVVTLGLFLFELHGTLKCSHLIKAGAKLEEDLGFNKKDGQFIYRPLGIIYFINEPIAAGIIYPAVLAAWGFLAVDFKLDHSYSVSSLWQDAPYARRIFFVGFVVALVFNLYLNLPEWKKRRRERRKEKAN